MRRSRRRQHFDGNTEAIEAFTSIVAAYEAFNRGDAIGWNTARGAPDSPPSDLDDPEAQYVAAAHAAGARYEVQSCSYDGFGESQGQLAENPYGGDAADGGSAEGHLFTCQTTMIDGFTEAAGLDFDEEFSWTVADGAVIDAVSDPMSIRSLRGFMQHLQTWMEEQRPQTPVTWIEWYNYPHSEHVPAVLELVDEFVADTDTYPLTTE